MIFLLGKSQEGCLKFFNLRLSKYFSRDSIRAVTAADAKDFALEKSNFHEKSHVCQSFLPWQVVISTEEGCSLLPLSNEKIRSREEKGRLNIALASMADCVILAGEKIYKVIKGSISLAIKRERKKVYVLCFRHGSTPSNERHAYAGRLTDEELSKAGIEKIPDAKKDFSNFAKNLPSEFQNELLSPQKIFSSPLQRAVQTAKLFFPDAKIQTVKKLAEMDFGLFEGFSSAELFKDKKLKPLYQKWVDSLCESKCPPSADSSGESKSEFTKRTFKAFKKIALKVKKSKIRPPLVIIFAHGGSQCAIFSSLPPKKKSKMTYFDWQTANAGFLFGAFTL